MAAIQSAHQAVTRAAATSIHISWIDRDFKFLIDLLYSQLSSAQLICDNEALEVCEVQLDYVVIPLGKHLVTWQIPGPRFQLSAW